jgi:quercetin dioxygenase-like cupin family protein
LPVKLAPFSEGAVEARILTPAGSDRKTEPYLLEIAPGETLASHFFTHKGEEFGYVLSGKLQVRIGSVNYELQQGDVLSLVSETPEQWRNIGTDVAQLLWIIVK